MSANKYTDLNPPSRILLGPGPSSVHSRVLRAMSAPVIGHLDPDFISIMDDVQEMLMNVYEAEESAFTIPVSGTGSAGMESSICNFIEEGDAVLTCVIGFFGERMVEMARRYGGDVRRLDAPWGGVITAEQVDEALKEFPAKVVTIVHGETSTGVLQPLEDIAKVTHKHGALLIVDAVATLGGIRIGAADIDIDVCYSGSQKCLSAPPGLAPVMLNGRAREVLSKRQTPVTSWYFDLSSLQTYWGPERKYHHTAPISMNYALREALRLMDEEGYDQVYDRHTENAELLWDGLESLDLPPLIDKEFRMPSLTTVKLPETMDEAKVRSQLMEEFNIEISGGLGVFAGKVWRIGLMGNSSRRENVVLLLGALERILSGRYK